MESNLTQAIINHIKRFGSITSKEAFELYGATRLSGIIFNLKKMGWDIVTEREQVPTRYGKNVSIARYRLNNE